MENFNGSKTVRTGKKSSKNQFQAPSCMFHSYNTYILTQKQRKEEGEAEEKQRQRKILNGNLCIDCEVLILVWLFPSSSGGFPLLSFSHTLPLPSCSLCLQHSATTCFRNFCVSFKILLKGHHLSSIKTREVEVQSASRLVNTWGFGESGAHGGGVGPPHLPPHPALYVPPIWLSRVTLYYKTHELVSSMLLWVLWATLAN